MRSQPQSLGFQQTSSGWNDESLVRCICSLHITGDRKVGVEGQEEGWWRGGKGGCYWYAPCGVNTWLISCRHSNDCLLWLICTSCRLPTEHTHREQVNANELQTFKGTFGSKSSVGDALYIAMFYWIAHIGSCNSCNTKEASHYIICCKVNENACMIAEHGGV